MSSTSICGPSEQHLIQPDAFTVTEVCGTQVQAKRGEEVVRRDAKKWKKINCKPAPTFGWTKEVKEDFMDADIGPPMNWQPQQALNRPEPALLRPQIEQHQAGLEEEQVLPGGEAEEVIVYAPDRPKRATRPPVLYQSDPSLIKGSKRSKK